VASAPGRYETGRRAGGQPGRRPAEINNKYLARFAEFQAFMNRTQELDGFAALSVPRGPAEAVESPETPD